MSVRKKSDYEIMITERNLELKRVIAENPPLQGMLENEDFRGFVESAHFVCVVKPYETRMKTKEEADLLKELLNRPIAREIDRDNLFERTMAITKNAEIIAQGLDAIDPTLIDTLIRTERLNSTMEFIENNRTNDDIPDEDRHDPHQMISYIQDVFEKNNNF